MLAQRIGLREMGTAWSTCPAIVSDLLDGSPSDPGLSLERPGKGAVWFWGSVVVYSFESYQVHSQAPLRVSLAFRSPLQLLVSGRQVMHGSSGDLLGGSGKRAKSTLSCVGTLPSTTLARLTGLVFVAFGTVQTAPFTCSWNLTALGTCSGWGTSTASGWRGSRAIPCLMIMLSLSLLRGVGR